ncbi:hypothetical protein DXG01_017238 [Tephrocybe rancida]|nr:hypothetical protein DXG01_017238 [Tephrocybe rancida]
MQEYSHGRKKSVDWSLSVGLGSQDLILKAVATLVDPGDPVLVESPVNAGVILMFHTLNCVQIEIEMDAHGIKSSSLKSILESWPAKKPKPCVLYSIPKVAQFYRGKWDVFEAAMNRHLSSLAQWDSPEAGMFFWFKLVLNNDSSVKGDSQALISEKAVHEGVLALPGTAFLPNGRKSAYAHALFSLLGEEDVDEVLR